MNPASIILSSMIFGVLVVIAVYLHNMQKNSANPLESAITGALEQLEDATRAHVQVTSIVSLVETLHERPELVEAITPYTRDVWAAALVNRVNNLSAALSEADAKLLRARKKQSFYAGDLVNLVWVKREVQELENLCDTLQSKLEAATTAAQALNRPHVVR